MRARNIAVALTVMSVLGLAMVSRAEAAYGTGYVCTVNYIPGSSTKGSYGYIVTQIYTGANCTGSWVVNGYSCSSGATDTSNCDTGAVYSESAINTLHEALRAHAIAAKQMAYFYASSSWKWQSVQFNAN